MKKNLHKLEIKEGKKIIGFDLLDNTSDYLKTTEQDRKEYREHFKKNMVNIQKK